MPYWCVTSPWYIHNIQYNLRAEKKWKDYNPYNNFMIVRGPRANHNRERVNISVNEDYDAADRRWYSII